MLSLKAKKISDRFYFKLTFADNKEIKIDFVEEIGRD
jgi:hypothetical protein